MSTGYPIDSPIEINGDASNPATINLNNNVNSIQISNPTTITSSYSITLPSSLGTAGQALVISGGSNTSWGVAANTNIWIVKDVKAPGTNGGSFTAGAWRTRDLNVIETPSSGTEIQIGVAPAGANQLLISDGSYHIKGIVPAESVNLHQARFRNITDAATEIVGTSTIVNRTQISNYSTLSGILTVTGGPKVYELQHRCSGNNATDGFGSAVGFGENEVYSIVDITKIG